MEGDFSRGHRPDAKRGRDSYRRVLLQQGRVLLDSDWTAQADATDRLIRESVTLATCAEGSPDLGFLVTAGELLAMFDPVHGAAVVATAPAEVARDFSRRFLGRPPSLRVRGGGGSVAIPLRRAVAAGTPLRLWLSANAPATLTADGTAVAVPAGGFAPFSVVAAGGATLTLAPDAAEAVWVGLIEAPGASGPNWAAGRYQIGGLTVATAGGVWPGVGGPAGAAFAAAAPQAAGQRVVAYLELAERCVTGVEDPGIVERALGGDHATTTRTLAQAQVKLAAVPAGLAPEAAAAAIRTPALPGGTVRLDVPNPGAPADVCDVPAPGGYTGPENRLYRLAVHAVTTGAGGSTLFKWSRENASELFPASLPNDPVDRVRVRAELPLRPGDLVELLSDATDLGDAAAGAVSAGGAFTRPQRAQGRLFRLDGGAATSGSTRDFTLRDGETEAPVAPFPAAPFGAAGVKLRRWSGLFRRAGTGAATEPLEHGIEASVAGAFEPGDWWQFEARALGPNANGPAADSPPHGPERRFAPLALLSRPGGAAGQPFALDAWLDERWRAACAVEADAVAYDGDRAGTAADTVQEALDELYLRVSDGCGDIAVPLGGSLQDVIDAIPAGGSARICLNAGTRDLPALVTVANKGDLIVGGIGAGTLLRRAGREVLRFVNCRSVELRDFAVEAGTGAGAVIDIADCGSARVETLRIRAAGPAPHGAAAIRVLGANGQTALASIRRCALSLGEGDSGIVVIDPGFADIADNAIETRPEPLDLLAALARDDFASLAGAVLIDRIHYFRGDGPFDFVASPVIDVPAPGPATVARRGVAMSNGMWGDQTLSFTTHATLDSAFWDAFAMANPPPGGPNAGLENANPFLRRLGARLARAMMGVAVASPVVIPPAVNARLNPLRELLTDTNRRIAGAAGVVVAFNRGPFRGPGNREPVGALFNEVGGQSASVRGNRIDNFVQGVRVAASGGGSTNVRYARHVDVSDNLIRLRLPIQARQRHGVMVGNALTIRVVGNRVEDPEFRPRLPFILGAGNVLPPPFLDSDGVRLFGFHGPMIEATGNFLCGVSVGVRLHPLGRAEPIPGRPDVFVREIRDNAYVGNGVAQNLSP